MKSILFIGTPLLLTTLNCAGQTLQTVTNNGNATSTLIKITQYNGQGAAGNGGEIYYDSTGSNPGFILGSYNRSNLTYHPLYLSASAITANAPITAAKFITSGGTSSQFLKADGSVDGTAYLSSSNISGTANYIPLFTGGNILGNSLVLQAGNSISVPNGRFTGYYTTGGGAPALEIGYGESGNAGFVQSYDRNAGRFYPTYVYGGSTANNYMQFYIDEPKISIEHNGSEVAYIDSAGSIRTGGEISGFGGFFSPGSSNEGVRITAPQPLMQFYSQYGHRLGYIQHGGSGSSLVLYADSGRVRMLPSTSVGIYDVGTSYTPTLLVGNAGTGTTNWANLAFMDYPSTTVSAAYIQFNTRAQYAIGIGNDASGNFAIGTTNSYSSGSSLSRIDLIIGNATGYVGIGTTNPQSALAVKGTITAQQVTVTQTGWPDFVFGPGYRLRSLSAIENYIRNNKHLPGIPSAKEVADKGLDLGGMEQKQMQKIEELTLYVIDQDKKLQRQEAQLQKAESENRVFRAELSQYKTALTKIRKELEQIKKEK